MNQDNGNIKVEIDKLANNIILQAIINSSSQSLLFEKEETKPSVEDIDRKMRQDLLATGMDDPHESPSCTRLLSRRDKCYVQESRSRVCDTLPIIVLGDSAEGGFCTFLFHYPTE